MKTKKRRIVTNMKNSNQQRRAAAASRRLPAPLGRIRLHELPGARGAKRGTVSSPQRGFTVQL